MQRGSGADAPVDASSSMSTTVPRHAAHGIPRWSGVETVARRVGFGEISAAAAFDRPYSHSIVAGGFEEMS
jgi:hypothetical protein